MKPLVQIAVATFLSVGITLHAEEAPQNVTEAWALFDPTKEPLEVEIIGRWEEDGVEIQHIRYVVGTFGQHKTRVAAFYAFPQQGESLPAIVQVHGGGQRATKQMVQFWASHGYAAIAVNWGEHVIGDNANDPNTDWDGLAAGFLDPKHHNDVSPGDETLHPIPHPWNSSWLLYAAATRRAITFLESQANVDGGRIGLTGHSMGGRLTVLTAIDPRIKAASPSVGGSGYLYEDIWGLPNSARRMQADLDLYNRTLDCRVYWPLIQSPVLFLGATNDFNSPMEHVIRGFGSLPNQIGCWSFAPHMNHRFTTETYAARVRWFQSHLKDAFEFPKMATSQLELSAADGVPRFEVRPDTSVPHKLVSVDVYYGFERDPRVRFWRSAEVVETDGVYTSRCPVMELNEPLFVFANVTYDCGERIEMPRGYKPTSLLTITSQCRQATPEQLSESGVQPVGERERLIDDFQHGWRDWFVVAAEHRHHWNFKTHKVNDPAFFGPRGASLGLEIETTAADNTLAVVLETDGWRGYTGRKPKRYTALVDLAAAGLHRIEIPNTDFIAPDSEVLQNYDFVTALELTPGDKERPEKIDTAWQGDVPEFHNLRWVAGKFASRPRTYLGERNSNVEAAFREAFDKEVDESLKREKQDE